MLVVAGGLEAMAAGMAAMAPGAVSTSTSQTSFGTGTPGTTGGISLACSRVTAQASWKPSSPLCLEMVIQTRAMRSGDGKQ